MSEAVGRGAGTICNPLDLPYRFQHLSMGPGLKWVSREAADPSVVAFQGRYFMFPSMSGGFWHSDDLVGWTFVATPMLPAYDYAPDVREIDGQLVVCGSRRRKPCPFFRTSDPLSGEWEEVPGTLSFWDPNLFQDEDGRVYLYWGCSAKEPIMGVELDRATLAPVGEQVELVSSDTAERGWERRGSGRDPRSRIPLTSRVVSTFGGDAPFVEGAWMTKHDGVYYLQYAAPGTELNTYSDGYLTGASPLGPFTYSPHSPFSSKPGGFITSAGHGSSFQDRYGNWWHAATMRICQNHMFERRLGLFPAGFDDDGVLFCNQEFGDHPMVVPDGPVDPWSLTPKWMLLSDGRPARASSADAKHPAALVVDEDITSWWLPADDRPGHWVSVDLGEGATVHAIQVNLAEHELPHQRVPRADTEVTALWRRYIDTYDHPTEFLLEGSRDGVTWETLEDSRGASWNRSHVYVELPEPVTLRHVRLTGFIQPYGSRFAVSGLRVFGLGSGEAPAAAAPRARRTGPLDALVTWAAVHGARGYNVRYGLAPEKLYASWMVRGRTSLDLSFLNAGHAYWVAVDAFNANGVTRGEPIPVVESTSPEN
jgi:xylan 1,4-beta-xylosidase